MEAKSVVAGLSLGVAVTALGAGDAYAQAQGAIPPLVERDGNWNTVSNVSLGLGVASVTLMPRVYYSSPDATVGWKARWHFSSLAPVMSMVGTTLLVDQPIKEAIQSPRPDCTVDQTLARLDGSGCETFGGPSAHAFAAWGAFGYGTTVFLVDTFRYSDAEFSAGSLVGNVLVPFAAAVMTNVARGQDGAGVAHESTGQIVAGTLPGMGIGALLGLGYSMLQEPDCGYGGFVFCW
ncbi:MAG: hypothetical protein AAGA56_00310 [Myxococcota bacterium]